MAEKADPATGGAVVVTTQVYHGGVSPIYGDEGNETLEKAGVIQGGDLIGPKGRILLMITLPQANGDHANLREYFKN